MFFLYKSSETFEDFTLQEEEVAGMVKVKFSDFSQLWYGEKDTIPIDGYRIDEKGNKILIKEEVTKDKFVPHQVEFYQAVIQRIKENL